ncbi:MAG: S9 family peptidase [Thermosynechococcaceae cyanobacterium]
MVSSLPMTHISAQTIAPPVAAEHPVKLEKHGDIRIDPYFWLRDRNNPEVINYLKAENTYYDQQMAPLQGLRNELFEEIKGRIKQDDSKVPYRLGNDFYYSRFEDGKQYPIYARKKGSLDADEQILLNVNTLAEGHSYYSTDPSPESISPNGRYLAWAADTAGRNFYTIRVLDMQTGKMLADQIPNVTANLVWANDNQTLFYAKQDPETLRWDKIFRHTLGTPAVQDVLVYEEKDNTFYASVDKTKDDAYVLIETEQTLTSEALTLDANNPHGKFEVFKQRDRGHEYYIDHANGFFYIRTNRDAQNFALKRTSAASAEAEWETVIPHDPDVFIADFSLFREFLAVEERKDGLTRLRIHPWSNPDSAHFLSFDDAAYEVAFGDNPDFESRTLRYTYESPSTPTTTYDYDVATQQRTQLKQNVVLGDFKSSDYQVERLMVPARDGAKVPVTVVYRKDRYQKDGSNPLLLYGYGAYGASIQPYFSTSRLSLLDRGFGFAIAHIRGSQTLGRQWYEDGKLLKKKNTFTDFIDAGQYLVAQGYADRDRLYAMGGSAGGLLMGAVMNMEPDLFDGIIAQVPWVDVVTTMLDDTIPLTTGEYDEWGNPNDPEYYRYLLSYSPYDNVEQKAYPSLLVTTGLEDSQVQYWEPAKWVAKLRAKKSDRNLLLLHTDMEAGHGGVSGRYEQYRETARDYAFLLHLAHRKSGTAPRPSVSPKAP